MYALRLELEGEQAAVSQLQEKLSQLAAVEQAATAEAAEVRGMLQAAQLASSACQSAAPVQVEQAQQQPAGTQPGGDSAVAASNSSSLGKQVGTAVSALLERIRSLEHQLAQQQAALEQAQQQPVVEAAAVQYEPQGLSEAAVQAVPASSAPASTQTGAPAQEAVAADSPAPGYGQADPQQQQVAVLTQQLAEARLAAVAAKAEQAAAQSKLQDTERQVGCLSSPLIEATKLLFEMLAVAKHTCCLQLPIFLRI